MKEVRNSNLVKAIREALPNVGHIKMASKDGRKASFVFRNTPFLVSSRLVVREQGIGKLRMVGIETSDSVMLSNRLRTSC